MPHDVFIVGAVRSPIGRGRADGMLHNVHPVDLLCHTLEALMRRTGVDKKWVEDVVCGCVTPLKEQGGNIARLAALKAGFPVTTPGVQLNRMCGSSQQAIHFASQAIAAGDMECVVACGVEMMSVVAMGSDCPGLLGGEKTKFKESFPYELLHQGVSAELIAEKWGLSRRACDELAAESHRRAHEATKKGLFVSQLVPIVEGKMADEGIRYPCDLQKMGKLPTIFKPKGGVVSAGNASQISDGAAAVLVCSAAFAERFKLQKRARIVSRVVLGDDPVLMLTGVIPATRLALHKANLLLDQIDVFEINEAFASVVLAWANELKPDMKRVNPNGGAIAHGHPLGATGAVLMTKLLHELERSGGRYGLQVMCIGHGQATCTIIENLSVASQSSKL